MGVSLEELTAGGPAVGVTVDGLSGSSPSRIAVWRQISGQERTLVQGMSNIDVTGAGYWVDYLPPLDREVTYAVDVLEGDAMVGTDTATITLPSTTAWFQDALNPLLALEVAIRPGRGDQVWFTPAAFSKLDRLAEAEATVPMGARLPVITSSRRRGPSGIPLEMVTMAATESALMRELLMEGTHLVLRVPSMIRQLDAVTHLGEVTVSENVGRQTFLGGHKTTWDLVGTQSRGPRIAAYTALWTYDDVQELYDAYSYVDVMDGRRYVDWVAHPEELGVEGFSSMGGGVGA